MDISPDPSTGYCWIFKPNPFGKQNPKWANVKLKMMRLWCFIYTHPHFKAVSLWFSFTPSLVSPSVLLHCILQSCSRSVLHDSVFVFSLYVAFSYFFLYVNVPCYVTSMDQVAVHVYISNNCFYLCDISVCLCAVLFVLSILCVTSWVCVCVYQIHHIWFCHVSKENLSKIV